MTEKRKPLTRQQFGLLIIKQDCLCGCGCGRKLDFSAPRRVTDEHLVPLFSSGGNELDNRALWLTECSTRKTAKEAPDRAKVRRFEQKKTQADKRAEGSSKMGKRPWPKGRKLQSRPFAARS